MIDTISFILFLIPWIPYVAFFVYIFTYGLRQGFFGGFIIFGLLSLIVAAIEIEVEKLYSESDDEC
jgi:hypothetical protein